MIFAVENHKSTTVFAEEKQFEDVTIEGASIQDRYELIVDEYVRRITALSARDIENEIERNTPLFYNIMGYEIKQTGPPASAKTMFLLSMRER